MSTEQNNDTQQPSRREMVGGWFSHRYEEAKLFSKTAVALLFIVNSVALGLYAFGAISPAKSIIMWGGAVSLAFAAIVLGTFVHHGVKFQSTTKRKK